MEERSGYIYVLQMDGHPYYKIGRTKNLHRRITEISPLLPTAHKLVRYYRVEDVVRSEAVLHEEFADQRMNGEWFRLSSLDLEYLHANCLYGQALRVCDRLIATLRHIKDHPLGPYSIKLIQALNHASKRLERRWRHFLELSASRYLGIETKDPILETEFVE